MKEFSSIIFWSVVFALILVCSAAAKYVSIPADSIVNNIARGSAMPKEAIYLLSIGSIALIVGFIHRSRKNRF
jgi:hypothetical protein